MLDYGCGAGQIVGMLRRMGINAHGCDVFYEGGDYSPDIPESLRPFIQRMEGTRIPCDAGSFDIVLSNQVFEHVPDMRAETAEIARVLKPGGVTFNLFPDRGVWREGHCGVPFLHRFPKGSTARIYYAALARALGVGLHKEGKSVMQWARDFCVWLDNWTYYRPMAEIEQAFGAHFDLQHAEEEWFRARFADRLTAMPLTLQRLIVRKFAGLVLIGIKAPLQS